MFEKICPDQIIGEINIGSHETVCGNYMWSGITFEYPHNLIKAKYHHFPHLYFRSIVIIIVLVLELK